MKYIRNRMEMNAFIDAALNAVPPQELEYQKENDVTTHILNRVTGDLFTSDLAEMKTKEEFDQFAGQIAGYLNDLAEYLYNEGFDSVVIVGQKSIISDAGKEMAVITATKEVNDRLARYTIRELADACAN